MLKNCVVVFLASLVMLAMGQTEGISPQNQPDWTLLLAVFVVSSSIAAIVGVVALLKKPIVPELPEFTEPTFDHEEAFTSNNGQLLEPSMTSYQQHPMENNLESYPMERMRSRMSEPVGSHESAYPPVQAPCYPQIPVHPPVTVMTHRM